MRIKVLVIFLFFCGFSSKILAQNTPVPINTILEKKSKILQERPFEKVHVHFDKPYYAVGDTIWFKTYVTTIQRIPTPLSKIVYLEMINHKDSIVKSIKLPLVNGLADGMITLNYPDFKEGNYHIRAFTLWMLNDDPNYFFSKNITVGNAINKQLSTNINWKTELTDKEYRVSTTINFKDDRLQVVNDKKVSWEVLLDEQRIAKGKETSNAKGDVTISFTSPSKLDLNNAILNTAVEMSSDRSLKSTFPLKGIVTDYDLQFFPEGGNFISGIDNRISLKAINTKGLGVPVSGEIIDQKGSVVTSFTHQHLGMGSFRIMPEENATYFAKAKFTDGTVKNYPLPLPLQEGIALTAAQNTTDLIVRLATNPSYLAKNPSTNIYVIAQAAGTVYYAAKGTINGLIYSTKIPLNNFPTGTIQLAVLNENGLPINERLFFNRRTDEFKIDVKTNLPSYKSREKVLLAIKTTGGFEMTEGSYSIAVIDETKVPFNEDSETTILSNILLTSDISGFIEQPNYYFNKITDQKKSDLDLLLLTQGYRRYAYKELLSNTSAKAINIYPEQSISISGTVRKTNGLPLAKGNVVLQVPSKYFNTSTTTDQNGKFRFENLVFKDSSDVVINVRNNINSKDLRIQLDGEVFPAIYPNLNKASQPINIDSTLNVYLKNSRLENNSAFYLNEVVVNSAPAPKRNHQDYSSLTGLSSIADREIPNSQFANCRNLTDCVSGMGLTFIDQQLFLTRTYNQGLRVPVAIYVGNNEVDPPYLSSLDPKNIESIEVFNNDGLTGINARSGTSGVMVINLKEGVKGVQISKAQLSELFKPQNVLTFKPKGYTVVKQFYVPKYTSARTSLQREDVRSTVYWNPNVITDKNGVANIEYFNADGKGHNYKIVIEGIDKNGNLGRTVQQYKIN